MLRTELHAVFIGQVQGVGFRYTAKKYADALGLLGTVKNLQDGSVELIAAGSEDTLNQFVRLLEEEAFPGKITEKKLIFQEESLHFSDFRIL